MSPILTPDQRLRVFVSSTLEELARERAAVQAAIERLRLTPVLFELAARPHPPRSLYLAYLRQSHLFVGIYWQSYGWVAPSMLVSGLEDELRESVGMPRLVYVKEPAPERDPRLTTMLRDLAAADVTYKRFETAEELERIVVDDLALLLTERFAAQPPDEQPRHGLPAPPTTFVGRTADLAALHDLLGEHGPRLVTLTGPGGVGKTRLALAAAAAASARFGGRVAFVPLASSPSNALLDAIASALGLYDRGGQDLDALVTTHLAEHPQLLVLDNFEHMLESAPRLRRLLEAAPELRILVTSRVALRVSGEQEFVVDPLPVPSAAAQEPARVGASDAVQLFVNRVSVVRRGFHIDNDNATVIAEICRRLDGLPLALELVAARAHVLSLEELRDRLGEVLDLPARAADVEERHRSLRRTLDWSLDQLTSTEQAAFARLGTFVGPFTAATAATLIAEDTGDVDVIDVLATLVDHSLLRADLSGGSARFAMLEIVRDYARSRLGTELDVYRARHAAHFRDVAVGAYAALRGTNQADTFAALDQDIADIGAAAEWLLEHERRDDVAAITWSLWLYFWQRGLLTTARRWTRRAISAAGPLSSDARARLLAADSFLGMWQHSFEGLAEQLLEADQLARASGDDPTVAHVQLALMMVHSALGDDDRAEESGREALALARRHADAWTEAFLRSGLCWLSAGVGRFDGKDRDFEESVVAARAVEDEMCIAMALANLGELRTHQGRIGEAARLISESLGLCLELSMVYVGAGVLDDASALLARVERWAAATAVAAAATAALEGISASLFPSRSERLARRMAECRAESGDDAHAAAWNEGCAWSFSRAGTEAIRELGELACGATGSADPRESRDHRARDPEDDHPRESGRRADVRTRA